MRRLESLEAWKVAREVAGAAYRLALEPPLSRRFSLADQIRRAAPSIPANIAEGSTGEVLERCDRVIGLIIGLIRSLVGRA